MEKQPHQEYRDELADKLREIRNSDPENGREQAQDYLSEQKETLEYSEALQLHKNDVEEISKKKDIDKKIKAIYIAEGNAYLSQEGEKGIDSAINSFKKADATDLIIQLADRYMNVANLRMVSYIYNKAGIEIPKDKLVKAGDICVAKDHIPNALFAYERAGATDKLVELGDISAKDGNLNALVSAYERARVEIPKEKLIECGDACAKKGYLRELEMSYYKAGIMNIPKEKFVECGNACAEKMWVEDFFKAYKRAGMDIPKEKLMECADLCAKFGKPGDAEMLYYKAGATDKIVELVDFYLKEGNFQNLSKAISLCEDIKLKDKNKLMQIGDLCIKKGKLGSAIRAYENAEMKLPKEKIIECAEVCVRNGWTEAAIDAYETLKKY